MDIQLSSEDEKQSKNTHSFGTLAIDLGNSTTVVAFQDELDQVPKLLDMPPISRTAGEIPSLVWSSNKEEKKLLVGQEVIELSLNESLEGNLSSDFKRWIGSANKSFANQSNILPEKAGEILIMQIWQNLPKNIKVERLVLTAPVETYRSYRSWLHDICSSLPVKEIALVDEPTAAAIGAGLPSGSKLLVVDIGGSTIDMSLVAIEGGEGKADPVAQLIRFDGKDLEGKSKQILRSAKVLGKAGQRIGGRDIDRWIANHFFPDNLPSELLLNAAERLKCRLSDISLNSSDTLTENIEDQTLGNVSINLSRLSLEEILLEKGLLNVLSDLLKQTLASGRANSCELENLKGVVIVGGGANIPLVKNWLEENIKPVSLITPPPIEAVAIGALKLTPGVKIKDILNKGVALRCWEKRTNQHHWHPLFMAGQPWPTSNALEIILSSSKENQFDIELILGEPEFEGSYEIRYLNGIPTIKEKTSEKIFIPWEESSTLIRLDPPGRIEEDCLKLRFKINDSCQLTVEGEDLRSNKKIKTLVLGSVQ